MWSWDAAVAGTRVPDAVKNSSAIIAVSLFKLIHLCEHHDVFGLDIAVTGPLFRFAITACWGLAAWSPEPSRAKRKATKNNYSRSVGADRAKVIHGDGSLLPSRFLFYNLFPGLIFVLDGHDCSVENIISCTTF